MNPDEIEQLEQLLRELPLRQPSAGLDERVLSTGRTRRPRWKRPALAGALAASAAIAATLLLMFLWSPKDDGPPVARPADRPAVSETVPRPPETANLSTPAAMDGRPAQPVRIEQIWSTAVAKEVVMLDESRPVHRVQHQVVRHVRWIDERRHVRIEWIIPSEQTVLVPLEYN